MMVISAIAAEDQLAEALLDGETYYIGRSWNVTGSFWSLSLRGADDEMLLSGIPMVPNHPLLMQHRAPGLPPGELVATYTGQTDTIGRDDFVNNHAVLVYMTQEECLDIAEDIYSGSV